MLHVRRVVMMLIPLAIACGGQTSGESIDASAHAGDGGDTRDARVAPGALDGGSDIFCQAEARYRQRCGFVTECDVAYLAWCNTFDVIVSDALKRVEADCLDGVSTCDSRRPNIDPCAVHGLDTIAPTDTQREVAVRYCTYCPGSVDEATCEKQFFHGPPMGPSYSSGWGDRLLEFNDGVAKRALDTCFVSDGGHDAVCTDLRDCIGRLVPFGAGPAGPAPRCDDGG